jgi:hypothetical protein
VIIPLCTWINNQTNKLDSEKYYPASKGKLVEKLVVGYVNNNSNPKPLKATLKGKNNMKSRGGMSNEINSSEFSGEENRNLDIKKEITDTKHDNKNGIKLLVLIIFIVVIIAWCKFLSTKVRNFVENDRSSMMFPQRKGKLEVLTGSTVKFKKFKDDELKDDLRDNIEVMTSKAETE